MQLKNITWSSTASAVYLRLLTAQRTGIDGLVRMLREADEPGPEFRQVEDHPDYWFTKTPNDLLMVVQRRPENYAVTAFADWRQQYDQALDEAAAALAGADEALAG